MFSVSDFMKIAFAPSDDPAAWLEGSADAVEYVVANSRSDDIILYTTVGQTYFHSVLAPLAQVTPPDSDDLLRAHMGADAGWALEHCSGGGEPDRMYLSAPLDGPGCKSLVGGEQLVFRRSFYGVDKGEMRTKMSQRLVQALDLYWMDEENAFCRLNDDGDVAPVIRYWDVTATTGRSGDLIVTIDAHQLHRYMAVTDMALVMKFDFTRYRSGSFIGWHNPTRSEHRGADLFYHSGVQAGCSFTNGMLIVRPVLTKEMLIAHANRKWSDDGKQYATFKALDWKNDRQAEISCAPSALASYFEPESPLPFQVTPAFFKAEVLLRYKADPEKYTLEHRAIHARAGWFLKTYDVNDAGQVHTYLCYLADLPYSEQLYWLAFNEWPKAPISQRAYQTDFEGSFSTVDDPLVELKTEIARLDKAAPDWWLPRGEALAASLHYPLTPSPEEWANAILALDQLVVEGIADKPIRARLTTLGRAFDPQWRSIRLLQEHGVAGGLTEAESIAMVEPLKQLHHLRSKVKGHAAETEKRALIKAARTEHGSLAGHFRHLVTQCQQTFDRLVEQLGP